MNEQLSRVRFTPMQRLFIEAYLVSKNITKAAIAAGCKERSAHAVGWKWFNTAEIRAEIDRRMAALFDRYAIRSDRIIRELAKIAFGNIGDYVSVQDDGGAIIDLTSTTRDQLAALNSIDVEEYTEGRGNEARGVKRIKIKLSDKRQALMDLAKIQRLLPADRHEHSGPGGGPIAFDANVKEEHKIDIEAMAPEEREQLRALLLRAVGSQGKAIDVEPEEEE
jgi:phage terminase small subunit